VNESRGLKHDGEILAVLDIYLLWIATLPSTGMQMGACAPIWIMRTAKQAYAAFAFLPVNLLINGQNNRTKAKVLMVPTK
jgi:hypothetical protein